MFIMDIHEEKRMLYILFFSIVAASLYDADSNKVASWHRNELHSKLLFFFFFFFFLAQKIKKIKKVSTCTIFTRLSYTTHTCRDTPNC